METLTPSEMKFRILLMGDGERLPIPHWAKKVATELSSYYLPTVAGEENSTPSTRLVISHCKTKAISRAELDSHSLVFYIPKPPSSSGASPDTGWLMTHTFVVTMQAMTENIIILNPSMPDIHLKIADLIASRGMKNHIKNTEKRRMRA